MWFSRLKYINIWPNLEFTSQRIPVLIGRYISIHTVLILCWFVCWCFNIPMMCVAKTTKITPKLVNQYDVAEPLTISHTELSVLETPLSVSTYQGDHYW